MTLNGIMCPDVSLRNYSITHSYVMNYMLNCKLNILYKRDLYTCFDLRYDGDLLSVCCMDRTFLV